jgi:hypothetical protein
MTVTRYSPRITVETFADYPRGDGVTNAIITVEEVGSTTGEIGRSAISNALDASSVSISIPLSTRIRTDLSPTLEKYR